MPRERAVDAASPEPLRTLASIPDLAGDHLNAQRFLDENGTLVRRSPELQRWYLWNGAWWDEDRLDRVPEMAANTIDGLRLWVSEGRDPETVRSRARHYAASAKAGRRDALLSVAGTDPRVVVAVKELDSHPMLIACLNGTVDLRTGELREARPSDLLTRGVSVDYAADADSSVWEAFVNTIFNGDAELIEYVQRLLGYCITGTVQDHLLPVLHGGGANGKSTLIGVVQDLLGEHAITAPEGLVIHHAHEPHPERIAALRGRRLVVSNELEDKAVLAEQTVKMLTGGDTLSGRELYGRRFNFSPTHKVLLVTNHPPRVRSNDHAIWRRVRLVPFKVTIPADKQDADLRRRLVDEHGPGVLAWLFSGAVRWHADGLGTASAVDVASEAYRAEQDTFGTFLAEKTVRIPRGRSKVGDLWEVWRQWCDLANERPGRKQDFSKGLEGSGHVIEEYRGGKYVAGLGILTEDVQPAEQEIRQNGEVW
jgi:putative DNA primase/helicase